MIFGLVSQIPSLMTEAYRGIRQIVIDGKVLRRMFSRASELSPLYLANAFAPGSGIVLGRVAVDMKSNKIHVLPALREMLDAEGVLTAVDAMRTHRLETDHRQARGLCSDAEGQPGIAPKVCKGLA